MTDRGWVVLDVLAGLAEVLNCRFVQDHLESIETVAPDQARLQLEEVNWFDDTALLRAAPRAVWQMMADRYTETPCMWLAHHPALGMIEGECLDGRVMVEARLLDPSRRTPEQERHLARLGRFLAIFDSPTGRWPDDPLAAAAEHGPLASVEEAAASPPGGGPRP